MPKDTRLNRHIAIFGASGTMKSRAVIRNALFQALKRGESVVITDPKVELYNDTSQMYRNAGYEVKVFNLVNPEHGDSWNCMSDLHGNTLMAQMLTNIIIGNTSNGKSHNGILLIYRHHCMIYDTIFARIKSNFIIALHTERLSICPAGRTRSTDMGVALP